MQYRQLTGSFPVACATIALLRKVVATGAWKNIDDLIAKIKEVGQKLVAANNVEFAIGNMVRCVRATRTRAACVR